MAKAILMYTSELWPPMRPASIENPIDAYRMNRYGCFLEVLMTLGAFTLLQAAASALFKGPEIEADEMVHFKHDRHLEQSQDTISAAVCGTQEYLCGESDVVLQQAYDALQSGNCSLDASEMLPKILSLQIVFRITGIPQFCNAQLHIGLSRWVQHALWRPLTCAAICYTELMATSQFSGILLFLL